jgi:hypothetical protein
MPADFPDLVRSIVTGLQWGLLLGGGILAVVLTWRWWRGEPLLPQKPRADVAVPLRMWVLGTVLFGSMGVIMLLNRSYSFGVWFLFIAALYCAGWIRTVRSERPKT